MDRISGSTTTTIGGKRAFINKNLDGGVAGTQFQAAYENDMQEELIGGLIEAAGLVATEGQQRQISQALKRMYGGNVTTLTAGETLTADNSGLVELEGGSAYVVDLPSPVGAMGFPRYVFWNFTGAAQTLVTPASGFYGPAAVDGSATMTVGPNQVVEVWPDGESWIVWPLGGQPHGYWPNSTVGAFSWTVPAGVFEIEVVMTGGGGPGGNCNSTTTSGYFAGAGGGAGATAIFKAAVTPGEVLSGVVGAPGEPSSTAPTAGGNTTFLGVTCGGGAPGGQLASSTPGGSGAVVTGTPTGVLGAMAMLQGGDGDDGQNGTFFGGGNGGDSWWGGGSRSNGSGSPRNAEAWGAGAGGAYNNTSGIGGVGAGGVVAIKW